MFQIPPVGFMVLGGLAVLAVIGFMVTRGARRQPQS